MAKKTPLSKYCVVQYNGKTKATLWAGPFPLPVVDIKQIEGPAILVVLQDKSEYICDMNGIGYPVPKSIV
jgi:hypothetical protein